MTRRIKDRTELLAYFTAWVFSRVAVAFFHCRAKASGAIIETPAFLTIPVAATASILAVGIVYFLEAKHTNDPCVRRHRVWDITEIVGLMVNYEFVSVFFFTSPWWMQLAVMIAGMVAFSLGKSLLRRSEGL
ncbi:MAG: hypothetical protein WCO60_13950 [Verrucomicrobiota bacterium]